MKTTIHCLAFIFLIAAMSPAQEPTDQQRERVELLKQFYRTFANRIQFATEDAPMRLVEKPVLSWTGQEGTRRFTSGDVFIWERDGRPEVVGCIGSIPGGGEGQRWVFQEFHSLATRPMRQTRLEYGGLWGAESAGVELQDIETDLVPSPSAPLRLAQMRKIATTFSAFMRWPNEDREERMRLVRKPLYRFDTKRLSKLNSNVVDGALFAYVWSSGTDPDVLLLVECRKDGGELKWKFGAVRFTSRILRLEHHDRVVWSVGEDHGSPTSPYRLADVGYRTYGQLQQFVDEAKKEDETLLSEGDGS